MDACDAARDIELGDFADWGDAERIAVNVDTLYRELRRARACATCSQLFERMAELARVAERSAAAEGVGEDRAAGIEQDLLPA